MNNPLENKEILSEEILNAIYKLLESSEDIVFGGSLCLNALDLINRPIKDLDIFTLNGNSLNYYNLIKFITNADDELLSETTTDVNGDIIVRQGAKVDNVNICIFKVNNLSYSTFTLYGRKIKIQNVNDAILAKRAYSTFEYKSAQKHKDDLNSIDNEFELLF